MASEPTVRSVENQKRSKQFALRIIRMTRALPRSDEARVIGRQLLRSGTAVGANYRAACRARARREFVAKMGIVVEEADESAFWIELLVEGEIVPARKLQSLLTEANELTAMFGAAYHTASGRRKPRP
jgi:four helix bundle protein